MTNPKFDLEVKETLSPVDHIERALVDLKEINISDPCPKIAKTIEFLEHLKEQKEIEPLHQYNWYMRWNEPLPFRNKVLGSRIMCTKEEALAIGKDLIMEDFLKVKGWDEDMAGNLINSNNDVKGTVVEAFNYQLALDEDFRKTETLKRAGWIELKPGTWYKPHTLKGALDEVRNQSKS